MNTPTNMLEILQYLDSNISEYDKKLLLAADEDDLYQYHHTVGRAMRNDWGLWDKESALNKWFNTTIGIWHADDMSAIILTSYHRHLKGLELYLEEQAKFYLDYWVEQEKNPTHHIKFENGKIVIQ